MFRLTLAAFVLSTTAAFAQTDVTETQAMPADADFIVTHFPMADSALPDPEDVKGWVAAYFEGTRSMDAAQWAAAFAPEAVLDDPVGAPVKDTPEAILAQGEGFVSAFAEVGLYESFIHVAGREAVARWQGRGTLPDGTEITLEGINHFTFDDDGKITLLRGFFTPPGM